MLWSDKRLVAITATKPGFSCSQNGVLSIMNQKLPVIIDQQQSRLEHTIGSSFGLVKYTVGLVKNCVFVCHLGSLDLINSIIFPLFVVLISLYVRHLGCAIGKLRNWAYSYT